MIEKQIYDGYQVGLAIADKAVCTRIDTVQKIVFCELWEDEAMLDWDRYFFYEGIKKNIPFEDLTEQEISDLAGGQPA